ncbi:MarR family transcriptional regulator [Arthrobacter frigidicola]|nr:MarR family transcriptional regulator [Arthrobacter frigidicola]
MLKLSTIYPTKYRAFMPSRQESTFELVKLVIRLGERMRQHYARRADEFDLTPTQAQVLRELTAGPAPMGELAVRLSCDASNMTGVSDRLEARGLLERLPSPGDRRVKVLSLTDDGRALHRSLWTRLMDNSPVAEGLNEAEQETLKVLLQKLERAGG